MCIDTCMTTFGPVHKQYLPYKLVVTPYIVPHVNITRTVIDTCTTTYGPA